MTMLTVVKTHDAVLDDLRAEIKMLRRRLDDQYRWNLELIGMLSRRIDRMEGGK